MTAVGGAPRGASTMTAVGGAPLGGGTRLGLGYCSIGQYRVTVDEYGICRIIYDDGSRRRTHGSVYDDCRWRLAFGITVDSLI